MDDLWLQSEEEELFELVFDAESAGKRIDAVIGASDAPISRNRMQQLIEEGMVSLNGVLVDSKKIIVKIGDVAEVRLKKRIPLNVKPEKMDLDIVYEDEQLLVVNKPKELVVHPAHGNETGTLVNGLLDHILESASALSSINGDIRPGIVHRIDKNTSGLLVIAKTDAAHKKLSEQLAAHEMTRAYVALVSSGFKEEEGVINASIGRDPKDRKKQKVINSPSSKNAVTHYKVLEHLGQASYIECRLETGRTHQIRVHMAHIGHPILGDNLYGSSKGKGQYLHAKTIGFVHPTTEQYIEFSVPPPEDFAKMLERLRNHD
jgi:23S rRNA pseudouridine1911/1915/1917 synthase